MRRRTMLQAAALSLVPPVLVGRAAEAAQGVVAPARVLVAAGDMNRLAETRLTGAVATRAHPDLVLTLGDQQYPAGSLADYRRMYDTTPWGRLKHRTRPVPGHHEYDTPGARGYFGYFGVQPYYAYDIGLGWRGYALNSFLDVAQQARWLRADLSRHPQAAVVATWSDPLSSSGTRHGGEPRMRPLWAALAGHRGLVLSGHEHNYERFAPRDRLRAFVVGTGGRANYPFGRPVAGSQRRITDTPGVLVLRLRSGGGYGWAFTDTANRVLDSGSA